jgi:hypothetical protein
LPEVNGCAGSAQSEAHNFISGTRWNPKFDEAVLKEQMRFGSLKSCGI